MADVLRFEVTEDHLKLMRRMNVGWNQAMCGAPEIDPKRPYGNGDHERDIAEILGWKLVETREGEELTKQQAEAAEAIHREMGTALEICLAAGEFRTGKWTRSNTWSDWAPVPEPR